MPREWRTGDHVTRGGEVPSQVRRYVHLAPSEVVLLHGERFAERRSLFSEREVDVGLPHTEERVSAHQLGRVLIATAMLACEAGNTIELQVRERRRLLGFRHRQVLYVDPIPLRTVPRAWPERSLESQIRPLAESLAPRGHNQVWDLVYHLLEPAGRGDPWEEVVLLVESGLRVRGLLGLAEERHTRLFGQRRLVLTPQAARQARREPLSPVRELLHRAERFRPDLWAQILEEIEHGVEARRGRTESYHAQ